MKKLAVLGLVLAPVVTFAQETNFFSAFTNLINLVIPVIFAIAVLFFLWSLAGYFFASADDGKKEAQDRMIWGVIVLVVMGSIFGIVSLFQTTLTDNNLIGESRIETPTIDSIDGLNQGSR